MSYEQYRPTGFKVLPLVVKNILIINGLFFLASLTFGKSFGIDLNDILGLHYIESEKFKPYQLITYMFMHGGFGHIFFNMFAVWMFGNVLENAWGPKRFLLYYLVTGIGAAIVHYIIFYFQITPNLDAINAYINNPSPSALNNFMHSEHFQIISNDMEMHFNSFKQYYNSTIVINQSDAIKSSVEFIKQYKIDLLNAPVIIGASGAVFGVLLAFGMMFPNSLIYVYFAIPIKAKWFVIIYGAIELYSGFANNRGDNVAHFAHLGGMLFGFFMIKYWQKKINHNQFN